jgi:D-glucuronyl C5-epimerase-like protein
VLSSAGVVVRCTLVIALLAALFAVEAAGAQPLVPPDPAPPLVGRAPIAPLVHARPVDDAAAISRGLRRAVAAGRLTRAEANEHRAVVTRARAVLATLRGSRRTVLARVLRQVAIHAGMYNRPRALALFSTLAENARWLARRGLPPNETDVVGASGVVYRVGWGYGLQFHPLANVIALNQHLYAERRQRSLDLASALAARAVPTPRGGAVWEYYFPYGGGRPPWTSGMAQAVGAQALARTGRRLTAPLFFAAARRAFVPIPGRLVRQVSTGPWVRLYSFSDLAVLNAHLQAALSVRDYGRIVNDGEAIALADRLEDSARGLLPRFDTGYWTNYSPGNEAPLEYHLYHVDLARFLALRTSLAEWSDAHARFDRYTREPPVFRPGPGRPAFYPWPVDGFRDSTRIALWVSKISRVTIGVGGARLSLGVVRKGWHSVTWRPGRRRPGTYRPVVAAVDLAGNRGGAELRPITIEVDRTPPEVTASVKRRRLSWRAVDPTTPWLRMTVVLTRPGARERLVLGRRPLVGSLRLRVPRGSWEGVLVVADSSGNRARVSLGPVPSP